MKGPNERLNEAPAAITTVRGGGADWKQRLKLILENRRSQPEETQFI